MTSPRSVVYGGAERFLLDDGWFRVHHDDTTSLGDWYPDEAKYLDGLGPIADYVHDKGIQFGLWVEPEMVSPDSDLCRRHPDWALGVDPYPQVTGRQQLVLDIARPEVSDSERWIPISPASWRSRPIGNGQG